jgi:poly(glycerol-phosphate) alpha-glucosyltransferase
VTKSVPQAKLEIIGSGSKLTELQELAEHLGVGESVIFTGYLPNAQDEYPRFALGLLCSSYEGQSLTVLEGLSSGTPMVSYDIKYGPNEMIEPDVSGELVPSGDIEALARAIIGILGDSEKILRYSQASYRWALEHGISASMQQTIKAIDDAVERFARRSCTG